MAVLAARGTSGRELVLYGSRYNSGQKPQWTKP